MGVGLCSIHCSSHTLGDTMARLLLVGETCDIEDELVTGAHVPMAFCTQQAADGRFAVRTPF